MKISECIRRLEELRRVEGDIEVDLPDGRPLKKITVVDIPARGRALSSLDKRNRSVTEDFS